jgi:hypothetical protein
VETKLAIAALLSGTLAITHSWLGERLILQPVLAMPDLPKLSGSRHGMQKIVRFAWHLTSIYFVAMGAILFYYSRGTIDTTVIRIIAITNFLSSIVTASVSRGRHYAWIVFLAIGILSWLSLGTRN